MNFKKNVLFTFIETIIFILNSTIIVFINSFYFHVQFFLLIFRIKFVIFMCFLNLFLYIYLALF